MNSAQAGKQPRAMVLGGYGLIGSACLRALAAEGYEVTGVGRDPDAIARMDRRGLAANLWLGGLVAGALRFVGGVLVASNLDSETIAATCTGRGGKGQRIAQALPSIVCNLVRLWHPRFPRRFGDYLADDHKACGLTTHV